jgi:hypothetical protein
MDDRYDADILLWSEQPAELLRRLAGGERVNDQVDWESVIDEVASVGREQLHTVEFAPQPGAAAHAEGGGMAAAPAARRNSTLW